MLTNIFSSNITKGDYFCEVSEAGKTVSMMSHLISWDMDCSEGLFTNGRLEYYPEETKYAIILVLKLELRCSGEEREL